MQVLFKDHVHGQKEELETNQQELYRSRQQQAQQLYLSFLLMRQANGSRDHPDKCYRRWRPNGFLSAFLLYMLVGASLCAQQFQVHVSVPASLRGSLTLTIYDGAQPRTLSPKSGTDFSGSVKQATYAELRHSAVAQPLTFFIENSHITVVFNKENPNASRITGSRSNSLVRYQLEQCDYNPVECLTEYVATHPDDLIAPYLLERHIAPTADRAIIDTLYHLLTGAAQQTYHYQRLTERLKHLDSLNIGAPLPHFRFYDDQGTLTSIDTLMRDSCMHLLMVGATWCDQCKRITDQLQQQFPYIKPYIINIDKQKTQWDSHMTDILAVDHLPYLLLLDADRRIVARDFRHWELPRIVKALDASGTTP
jgi:hypothetical protein